ncbi:MAG: hypothetical protein ACXAE3_06865 [Candidatus Kariarchaeaceae archaeon]|jgi:hypothetical protein
MSHDPFDDLPENIKNAIREMMKKLQEINPEDLEKMMSQMLGEDFMEKMREMQFSGGAFNFDMDPNLMKNFEGIMKNFMENPSPSGQQEKVMVEEPYYEFSFSNENEGELVVDLPGISDLRHVNWENKRTTFELEAENEDVKYFLEVPVKDSMKFKDMFASLRNSVFILPFKRD